MKYRILIVLLALFTTQQVSGQNKVSYTYDANNQLTQVVYYNGTTVKYTYDALGNRLSKKVTTMQKQYTVALTSIPDEGGSVTGEGKYYEGTSVTIKAVPNEDFVFTAWSDGETDAIRTIVVDRDYVLSAYFEKMEATNQYTITLSANPAEGGRVSGGGTFDEGEYILIKAMANPGYTFSQWSDGNINSERYYLVTSDASLVAYFSKNPDATGILGDVNNDGVVNADDATYIRNAYMGWPLDDSSCDLDADGNFTIVDVAIMNAILNGTYNNGSGDNDGDEDDDDVEMTSDIEFFEAPQIRDEGNGLVNYMVTGYTYKVNFKIKNISDHVWEGNLYLLANSDTVKIWNDKDYEPEGRASINATYVAQSAGTVRLALYNQPAGVKKSILVSGGEYDNPVIVTVAEPAQTQGTYNGYNYVNLGLPSGTLWATCNIGANRAEDYGTHFAWGETECCDEKREFQPKNYKYYDYSSDHYTKYYVESEDVKGYVDNLKQLLPEDDAATVHWGGYWRMPTEKERDELMNTKYTAWTLTTVNGVLGYRVESIVSGYEGISIFLPLAGYDTGSKIDYKVGERGDYWMSTLDSSYPSNANSLYLTDAHFSVGHLGRYQGRSIRPVVSTADIDK